MGVFVFNFNRKDKMPGHDHHLNFVFQPGDLNSECAVFNWSCPIEEDDGEDITVIIKWLVLILLVFFSLLFSFFPFISSENTCSFLLVFLVTLCGE